MPQSLINAVVGIICGTMLTVMGWLLIEVNEQGKQSASFTQAGKMLEKGYSIIIEQLDNNRISIGVNSSQIGRNSDKIERNERDIEKLSKDR